MNIPFNINNINNSNSDSDSDDYIDLSTNIETNSEHIFQFNLNDNILILKHIGKCTKAPDIIIKENFGPESNMSLYNCVYTHNELILKDSNELFFPLVKLIIGNNIDNQVIITTCIAIKLYQPIVFDKLIDNWDLYWVKNKSNEEYIKTFKLEKNINLSNMVEKIIEFSMIN